MLDHVAEPLCPDLELEPVRLEVDALDQQLDDADLLGGEEFLPEWIESLQRVSDRALRQFLDLRPGAARQVATTTSGDRSRARSWSMTAASTATAETRRMGDGPASPFRAAWRT